MKRTQIELRRSTAIKRAVLYKQTDVTETYKLGYTVLALSS